MSTPRAKCSITLLAQPVNSKTRLPKRFWHVKNKTYLGIFGCDSIHMDVVFSRCEHMIATESVVLIWNMFLPLVLPIALPKPFGFKSATGSDCN